MRVLIIGINGFIGAATARAALAQGHLVYGLGRSEGAREETGATYLVGDRTDTQLIRRLVVDHKIEVVVDVIAMTQSATQPLLEGLDGAIDQYVLISSCDVYSNYERLQRRSEHGAIVAVMDEDAPLRTTRYPYRGADARAADDPQRFLDDYDKIPIEESVARLRSAWTILRLPMVYGPGDKQRRFNWAIGPMLAGAKELTVPATWAHWHSTYGHIENVGAAIATVVGNKVANKQTFNIAEDRPVSQLAWARRFANAIEWHGEIELMDDPDDAFAKRLRALDLGVPFLVDGGRFRQRLGFSDVVDKDSALRTTIASESSFGGNE